jgi:hypothetical protein
VNHKKQKVNLVIFGHGSLTKKIIQNFLSNNNRILCITNDPKISSQGYGQYLRFMNYQSALQYKIESDSCIFTWRQKPNFIDYEDGFSKWLRSDQFLARQSFLLSSASVYKDSPYPVTESQENLELKVELNSKYVLETVLTDLMKDKNLRHTNLRISNVYGENLVYGFIGSLIESIKSNSTIYLVEDQNIVRDYLYVEDLSYAIQELIRSDIPNEILNISSGIGTTIGQIIKIFADNGFKFKKIKRISGEENFKKSSILSCSNLSQLINWNPVAIEKGVMNILKDENL